MARHEKKEYRRGALVKSILFFGTLVVLMVVSLLIPLRPSFSAQEKRELTPFPQVSFGSLLSGELFRGIDDWFADTLPGRDSWLGLNQKISGLYGIKTVEITGEIKKGDDIPDAPFTGG